MYTPIYPAPRCNCAKCGHDLGRTLKGSEGITSSVFCTICQWLLKLAGATAPRNLISLGLADGEVYRRRQLAEPIPHGKRPEYWYEVA